MAMSLEQFDVVNKLICAGAECNGLNLTDARGKPGSFNTFKILYKLGHAVEIHQNDDVSDWIRSQPITSLLELSVIAVRQNSTRTELDALISELKEDNCGFPNTVLEYLELKHLTKFIEDNHLS